MELILLILGTYFLTAVLTRTDGPKGFLYKLRKNENLPFYCFTCTAIYAAVFLVLINIVLRDISMILAVAGGAVILNDAIERLL